MVHIFQPKLLNGPYGDPVVYISLFGSSKCYLLDLGDISKLSNKHVLKLEKIFISHTHMDHFYGFDRVVRTFLGKDKTIKIYGPKNIIKNIDGKLKGYTWNLVDNYKTNFTIQVYEIYSKKIKRAIFKCKNKFKIRLLPDLIIKNNIIAVEDDHVVKAVVLDHKTPCISYILEENFHINILKDQLENLGLETGKWLNELKKHIYNNNLYQKLVVDNREFLVKDLKESITKITPGHKITYITDIIFSKKNINKLKKLVKNTTFLYIETPFLNKERIRAKERFHLTAKQAGYIAKMANAVKVIPFHISPLHVGEYNLIKKELLEVFQQC